MKDETPFRLDPGVKLPSQRSVTNRATSFGHGVAPQSMRQFAIVAWSFRADLLKFDIYLCSASCVFLSLFMLPMAIDWKRATLRIVQ